jgi:uncharacterized membrane protein YhhN
MDGTTVFPIVAVFTLGALLYYGEYREDTRRKWIFKPATSALFILTALSGGPNRTYDWLLIVGLVLCLVGDVFLISSDRRWFLAGLISFLLGHVVYITAFNSLVRFLLLDFPVIAVIVLAGVGIFWWLNPHLGEMRGPVIAYMVVISLMLMSAWAVFFEANPNDAPDTLRNLVAVGATAFYLSDITVARDRFMHAGIFNRVGGLPLYYIGQFMLALSVGMG